MWNEYLLLLLWLFTVQWSSGCNGGPAKGWSTLWSTCTPIFVFFFHITSAISFICLGRSHVFRTFLRWASRTNPCKLIDCSLIYNEASLQIVYVPSQWAKVNIKKKHENQRNGILRNIGTWSACVITSCDHPIFAKWTNNAMWEWKHMA